MEKEQKHNAASLSFDDQTKRKIAKFIKEFFAPPLPQRVRERLRKDAQVNSAGFDPWGLNLETAEQTAITMAELRQWIENLPEPGADPFDFRNASTMRRLRAEQVLSSFNATLGLSDTDYFSSSYNGALNDSFPARSPDEAPYSYNYSSNQNQVYPRFTALGGPHWLEGKRRSNDITAPFLQTLVQMAQVRCRLAVKKGASDTAIFQFATRDMTSAQDAAAIRENIAYLFLRLLADPPSEEELDHLTDEVFKTYEDQGGETAWTAVCATLVRDPRWLSY